MHARRVFEPPKLPLFPYSRHLTLITQYWLDQGKDESGIARFTMELKLISINKTEYDALFELKLKSTCHVGLSYRFVK